MRVTPLSFHFQRFSLLSSRLRLSTRPVPHAVSHNAIIASEPTNPAECRGSRDLSIQEVRFDKPGVTRGMPTDPLLASPLSEVLNPLALASCFHETSSHGLQHLPERRTVHVDACSAECQRTRGLICLFRERPTSLRSTIVGRLDPKNAATFDALSCAP
jgi:hypothetical protein